MKIGVITFHFPYNCGAVLQCFALKHQLEKLGHEVCVINYRPWYHQNRYTPLKNPIYYASKRFHETVSNDNVWKKCRRTVGGFIRVIYSWKNYFIVLKREKKFHPFIKKNLNETKVYRTLKQLETSPPKCDVYISGSDQLWNSAITNGDFDPAYFLKFGSSAIKKITYSIGADFSQVQQKDKELGQLIEGLNAISIREKKWFSYIQEVMNEKITLHVDVDPTLLLKEDDYLEYMPQLPMEKKGYILTYTMPGEVQAKVNEGARMLAEKTGLSLIDISGNPNDVNREIADNRLCGPDEFLWYIYNAEYIMTNSFHGSVFSIIFKKKFVTIPHAVTGNRVTELLDKLNLSHRYCYDVINAVNEIQNDIDYTETMELLDALRADSINYLDNNI